MFPRRSEDQKSTPVNVSTYNTQRRDKEKKMKMRTTYPAAQHDKNKNDMTRKPGGIRGERKFIEIRVQSSCVHALCLRRRRTVFGPRGRKNVSKPCLCALKPRQCAPSPRPCSRPSSRPCALRPLRQNKAACVCSKAAHKRRVQVRHGRVQVHYARDHVRQGRAQVHQGRVQMRQARVHVRKARAHASRSQRRCCTKPASMCAKQG